MAAIEVVEGGASERTAVRRVVASDVPLDPWPQAMDASALKAAWEAALRPLSDVVEGTVAVDLLGSDRRWPSSMVAREAMRATRAWVASRPGVTVWVCAPAGWYAQAARSMLWAEAILRRPATTGISQESGQSDIS